METCRYKWREWWRRQRRFIWARTYVRFNIFTRPFKLKQKANTFFIIHIWHILLVQFSCYKQCEVGYRCNRDIPVHQSVFLLWHYIILKCFIMFNTDDLDELKYRFANSFTFFFWSLIFILVQLKDKNVDYIMSSSLSKFFRKKQGNAPSSQVGDRQTKITIQRQENKINKITKNVIWQCKIEWKNVIIHY